jgi:hypothetical protein
VNIGATGGTSTLTRRAAELAGGQIRVIDLTQTLTMTNVIRVRRGSGGRSRKLALVAG